MNPGAQFTQTPSAANGEMFAFRAFSDVAAHGRIMSRFIAVDTDVVSADGRGRPVTFNRRSSCQYLLFGTPEQVVEACKVEDSDPDPEFRVPNPEFRILVPLHFGKPTRV